MNNANNAERQNFISLCRELSVYAVEHGLWTPALAQRYREMVDTLEREATGTVVGLVALDPDYKPITVEHPLAKGITITFHEADAETVANLGEDWVIPLRGPAYRVESPGPTPHPDDAIPGGIHFHADKDSFAAGDGGAFVINPHNQQAKPTPEQASDD